ncbi:MAG TPA: GTPase Era [Firmicutes bacterium]|nr:GTPase Era [Bacillota bacterium]
MKQDFRSGFVAIVGRPNVGKSTLVNHLVGHKIAIVSDKPQTTRNRIQCVLTRSDAQVIFLDTPGIHKPRHKLGEYMVQVAQEALEGVDCILFLVDGAAGIGYGDRKIAEQLAKVEAPVILVVNKVDRITHEQILTTLAPTPDLGDFQHIFPISAKTGYNVPELLDVVIGLMPPGPMYFPSAEISDHPEQFVMAELIREQALRFTRDEVPHALAVVVDAVERREDKDLVDVQATIYVERDSQKGIIIGKQGNMLKVIGSEARREIEALLGSQVFLQLAVKVNENWRKEPKVLRRFGYVNE